MKKNDRAAKELLEEDLEWRRCGAPSLGTKRGDKDSRRGSRPRATEAVTGCRAEHEPPYSHRLYRTDTGWLVRHRPTGWTQATQAITGCQAGHGLPVEHGPLGSHGPPYHIPILHSAFHPPAVLQSAIVRHSTLHSPSLQHSPRPTAPPTLSHPSTPPKRRCREERS